VREEGRKEYRGEGGERGEEGRVTEGGRKEGRKREREGGGGRKMEFARNGTEEEKQ